LADTVHTIERGDCLIGGAARVLLSLDKTKLLYISTIVTVQIYTQFSLPFIRDHPPTFYFKSTFGSRTTLTLQIELRCFDRDLDDRGPLGWLFCSSLFLLLLLPFTKEDVGHSIGYNRRSHPRILRTVTVLSEFNVVV